MIKRFTRFLSCLLVFVLVLPFLTVTSHAVVPPMAIAYSALASYVASTGYRLYQDEGVGESLYTALSSLYDSFLESSDPVGALSLDGYLQSGDIFVDNSGNLVIKKAAADIFQQFSDWIKTEYDVPVGSDVPTTVVDASDAPSDDTFIVPSQYYVDTAGTTLGVINGRTYFKTYDGPAAFCIVYANGATNPFLVSRSSSASVFTHTMSWGNISRDPNLILDYDGVTLYVLWGYGFDGSPSHSSDFPYLNLDLPSDSTQAAIAVLRYMGLDVSSSGSGVVKSLGVTLAQDVVNQAAKANDDDAVVIGVGAQAGVLPDTLADIVADGLLAGTLNPTVTITADAVIDTPVQPYPDVDSLGLPTLGAALVSRFPFCVPWDFVDTLRILNADPIPPVFDVTLVPASVASRWGVTGNYTLHVDLTSAEYAKLFTALRWGTLVGFCLGLALLTKRLIWTA